jgi:hypothetical protein
MVIRRIPSCRDVNFVDCQVKPSPAIFRIFAQMVHVRVMNSYLLSTGPIAISARLPFVKDMWYKCIRTCSG